MKPNKSPLNIRLLNAMASTQAGRDYLSGQPLVLSTLVRSLVQPTNQLDQTTTEMVVATLQKLSLKYVKYSYIRGVGVETSVMDLKKLSWDPDPGICPNLDPDPSRFPVLFASEENSELG